MKQKLFLTTAWLVMTAGMALAEELTQYVDPLIGSAEHGHVFVGANVPYGFVQLGPSNIKQDWDWCSGYNRSDSTIIGFAHTHLSGTGCGDLHDIMVMPVTGQVTYARGNHDDQQSGLWSYQDRTKERAQVGYYATRLKRYGIDAELTATSRVGLHRYTFPESKEAAIVIDLVHGGGWDRCRESALRIVDDHTIEGYRYSGGWADDERIFFRAEFSRPFESYAIIEGTDKEARTVASVSTTASAKYLYFRANFKTRANEQILVKVALSPTSTDGALRNMQAELLGWDFEQTVKQAKAKWQEELQKITIKTDDTARKRTFYTAMFHLMVAPSEFCDVNGDYYGADHRNHASKGHTTYTTYSLWDTYRAAHPLMTIIQPERVPDMIRTMLDICDEQGKLPVWHLMGCETNCMVGYPAIPVVADALLKVLLPESEWERAYEAMVRSTEVDERGLSSHRHCGYIPTDSLRHENVAYELEYDLADWALAQVARRMGKDDDYKRFLSRSRQYKNLFDPTTRFIRPKDAKGNWRTPFDPIRQVAGGDDYCEGNAWQYTFLVPHDIEGLIDCFGSKQALISKLDSLFTVTGDLGENAAPDISGLIGQYAHGNEPSHHIAYLYTLLGEPRKAADRIRQIQTTLYTDRMDGICGNEDVGQMSAWYILSALGFYQVEPAGGRYVFGTPLFPEAEVKVKGGTFRIVAHNVSDKKHHIRKICLNGKPYNKWYIDHKDIENGGLLEFYMTN
ncbi:MAG: GH92 family glycosyl hydrolase [Prevotella sp.]|nr:GH92 family glycosyl hydrolase [Prevotella sp.]